jgi:hypothetical protein
VSTLITGDAARRVQQARGIRVLGDAALAGRQLGCEGLAVDTEWCQAPRDARLRLLERARAIAQLEVVTQTPRQAVQIRQHGLASGQRRQLVVHRGVLLQHRLDALMRIAARGGQILVFVVDFILVELELRLREVQLVLQRTALRIGSFRDIRRQAGHARFVRVQLFLQAGQPRIDLLRLRTQHRRMRLDPAQRCGERDIHLVIGRLHHRLRRCALLRGGGLIGQRLGRHQIGLIDLGRRRRRRRPGTGTVRPRGIRRRPQTVAYDGQEHEQHDGEDSLQSAHGMTIL